MACRWWIPRWLRSSAPAKTGRKVHDSPGRVYGFDMTVHASREVNVEVDELTGEVVSVWFRCAMLPFNVSRVSYRRARDMREAYEQNETRPLTAVVFEEAE